MALVLRSQWGKLRGVKYRFPAFVLILVIVVGLFWRAWLPKKASSTPDLAPLRQQLEAAAEKALPLPTLGGWTIEVTAPATQIEPRIAALIDLAQKLGGNAQRVLDRDQSAVVMLQIPEASRAMFSEKARAWPWKSMPPPAANTGELLDGEVIFHPAQESH